MKDITVTSSDITSTSNEMLYDRLTQIKLEVADLAVENVGNLINGGGFTGPEVLALTAFEKLKLLGDYDLINILLKGEIINDIESKNLHTVLPDPYSNPELAIEIEAGLSPTEQSQIKDLTNTIVPWIISKNEMPVAEFWQIKRSNLREIIPHLKVLITQKPSDTGSVNDTVNRLKDSVRDVDPDIEDDELTDVTISQLIEAAKNTKNRELRDHLRPQEIPPMDAIVVDFENGNKFIFAKADQDQFNKIAGTGTKYFDFRYMEVEGLASSRMLKEFKGKEYPTAEEKINEYRQLGTDSDRNGD